MKLRTVLPVAAITGAAALGGGAVVASAQEGDGPDRPAPSQLRGGQHSMMDRGAMCRMNAHHEEMTRQMRKIDPEMAEMMDRHHAEMMRHMMRQGGMGDMGRG